jgi:hypothetical protein
VCKAHCTGVEEVQGGHGQHGHAKEEAGEELEPAEVEDDADAVVVDFGRSFVFLTGGHAIQSFNPLHDE